MNTLNKYVRTIAASAVFALGAGVASTANAAPAFQVDPTSIVGTGSIFTADFISGFSSALITNLGGNVYQSEGWINYTSFSNGPAAVLPGTSRVGVDYGLYATFTQLFTCGGPLGVGVTCGVTSIDLSLFADVGFGNNYISAALPGTVASVIDGGTADIKLGTASLIVNGVAGLNAAGGAFENVNTNFVLTAAGKDYFINPVPFYTLAFSNFNNTTQGIQCDTVGCVNVNTVSINSENGGTDFNRIPEPATLALLGLGLLGAGVSRRRKL